MQHIGIEIFLWLLGLCIGSFLNVLVFRLPRGVSIARPRWSFCPSCATTIAWYDNIPLLSWLLLRGRCRRCEAPISVQYPLIETLTGLAFVLVYHLLFVSQARAGLPPAYLPVDAPLLAAWIILVAVLIACSAMDIVSYMIDIRVTDAALISGIVLYALWPRSDFVVPSAASPWGAAALATFIAGAAMLWASAGEGEGEGDGAAGKSGDPAELEPEAPPADAVAPGAAELPPADQPSAVEAAPPIEDGTSDAPATSRTVGEPAAAEAVAAVSDEESPPADEHPGHVSRPIGLAGSLLMTIAALMLIAGNVFAPGPTFTPYILAASGVLVFLLIVLAGAEPRPADAEIHAAVESERPLARRRTGAELLWLAPVLLAGVAAWGVVSQQPAIASGWRSIVSWEPLAGWAPVAGAVFSIEGAIAGAAAGWVLRIVFTLIFGREAFGVGDIFILSAAGAVIGWDLVLLGLALAVVIALIGWFAGLILKNSAMIPFGPWLGLGFLVALWCNRPAERIAEQYRLSFVQTWQTEPRIFLMLIGLMLLGGAVSIALAMLLRRWLGPPPPTMVAHFPPPDALHPPGESPSPNAPGSPTGQGASSTPDNPQ